ncbi:MAG: peptidylprolyl isomerase [Flavobacteriales bacterium]|jgi:peptidyl-prolyl cis-trans isomerase SurA|nr:peptidylprolyl isomerase [Flavobacteriales bacterium]MDG1440379.1 peptidylprolyl isomerase [Flavobacteriales bacterium]
MRKIIWCLFFNLLVQIGISQEVIDQVVAIVGENPILYSEIQGQKLQILQQGGELDGNIDCYLIDEFMTQQLLIHQAEIDSLEVTEEMVKVELDQRIQYFSAQVGGTEALEEFYGQSIEEIKEEFFEQIEDKMKAQKMQQEVTGNISVSPSEVRSFFYKIPFDSVPFINSKVKVSQLVIAPEITYGQKEATKKKLRKIKNRIYSNEISFSVAAEFYSNDPGSKANGGNFGWVSRGDFVPEFDAIAYTIPLNTVSDVFESPFGFHILKIEKRRGEQYYGSHILIKNEVNEEDLKNLKERCTSIFDELRADKISWANAIKTHSTLKNNSANGIIFNESTGDMYWDMENIDKSLFVGINNIDIGEFSEPLYYQDSKGNIGYRILKLEDRTTPHKANLDDDYEYIQKFALNEKQINEMDHWVNKSAKNTFIEINDIFKKCDFKDKWNIRF